MQPTAFIHRLRDKYELLLLLGMALFLLVLALISPVTYASGDPHFSLIVSQSILENGTTNLDAFYRQVPELFDEFAYQVDIQDGHWFYNYPIGPSIFSLPFVAVARFTGSNMLDVGQNHSWQNIISAVMVAGVFLAIYQIARAYLGLRPALAIALVTMLGSTLISTLGTALWNLDFAVFFVAIGVCLVARHDAGRSQTIHPFWLAGLLFAAFFSRPSTALFILLVLVYCAIKARRFFSKVASTSLTLLLLFLLFSYITTGRWLPVYYSAGSWLDLSGYLRALYGVVLSPSRGFIVFSPYLVVTFAGIFVFARRKLGRLLFWLCVLWVLLHILSVAATPMWWGGYSYGPRLLTDSIPGLVLISAVMWREVASNWRRRQRQLIAGTYLALGLIAVLINSFVGLFNVKVPLWNAYPDVDIHTSYLYDWQYPQFLVTSNNYHQRRLEHHLRSLEEGTEFLTPTKTGQTLSARDDPDLAIFSGWWIVDDQVDWTEIGEVTILFYPGDTLSGDLTLVITTDSLNQMPVEISLNDHFLDRLVINEKRGRYEVAVDSALIKQGNINRLDLDLPEARNPSLSELRQLGLRYAPHRLGLRNFQMQLEQVSR